MPKFLTFIKALFSSPLEGKYIEFARWLVGRVGGAEVTRVLALEDRVAFDWLTGQELVYEVQRLGSSIQQVAEQRYWTVKLQLVQFQVNSNGGPESLVAKQCQALRRNMAQLTPASFVELSHRQSEPSDA